jgi:hypothetical protein
MTTSKIIWLVVMSIGVYVCGGLCIFRTGAFVGWAQRNHAKGNRLVRAYPFSDTVMKPWYPTYIRAAGVFIWLWALAIDCLVLFRGFR